MSVTVDDRATIVRFRPVNEPLSRRCAAVTLIGVNGRHLRRQK